MMRIKSLLIAVSIAIGLMASAAPLQAQEQFWGTYMTYLGPEDRVNSRGVRLTSAEAIVQQDRANMHRFGIRHAHDERDPWFNTKESRAAMGRALRIPSYYADIITRQDALVVVSVFGIGGRITRISIQIPG
ncbi:MAG: hypothetical protein N4A53_09250 [Pelagimonas sp.]|jgi:hypothetical protein|nr:hypothetical protein [Pelagimonas sp.]